MVDAFEVPDRALWIPARQIIVMTQRGWDQLRPAQRWPSNNGPAGVADYC